MFRNRVAFCRVVCGGKKSLPTVAAPAASAGATNSQSLWVASAFAVTELPLPQPCAAPSLEAHRGRRSSGAAEHALLFLMAVASGGGSQGLGGSAALQSPPSSHQREFQFSL